MDVLENNDQKNLFKAVAAAAREQAQDDERQAFQLFLQSYFADEWQVILPGREPDELAAIALEHWRWGRQRSGKQPLVRVYSDREQNPDNAKSIVELVVNDLAFLIPTVTMAIRDMGCAVHWLLHPIVLAERDDAGVLTVTEQGQPENWLRLEIGLLPDREAEQALEQRITVALRELGVVVDDWAAMRDRALTVAEALEQVADAHAGEAAAFLRWLEDDHFTFLGYRKQHVTVEDQGHASLTPVPPTGLGIMREQLVGSEHDALVAPPWLIDEYARLPQRLIINKSQTRSRLHHPGRMDVVAIKELDEQGSVVASHRFLGLFTSEVYVRSPYEIPLLARKLDYVTQQAQPDPGSYAAKSLKYILETFPRDELFQSDREQLYRTALGVLALRERSTLGVFTRRDRYRRFVSVLVYLPQDQYGIRVRDRMAAVLKQTLQGLDWDCRVTFLLRNQALLHFTVQTEPGAYQIIDESALQAQLQAISMGWQRRLHSELVALVGADEAARIWAQCGNVFPDRYQAAVEPDEAAQDLRALNCLSVDKPLTLRTLPGADPGALVLKLYVREHPVALSDILPKLEFFGLRVIAEEPYEAESAYCPKAWIQVLDLQHEYGATCAERPLSALFEEAFLKVHAAETDSDGLNSLVFSAALPWHKVRLLRALSRYLIQTDIGLSYAFMAQAIPSHPDLAASLLALFETRFEPGLKAGVRKREQQRLHDRISTLLEQVPSLDADRVLRGLLSVIQACVRTNYYQHQDTMQTCISFKLRSEHISELPVPRPLFETFVYSPDMEGIHLRAARVSRGGLRWSDRREDFRTEVLGLMKTQQVKNAITVPAGAKGGFVVKTQPADVSRRDHGIACYQQFIRGLLDLADNRRQGKIVPPANVVCHDEEDSYLVVAADKGTAGLSDVANAEAARYEFWLGDAFASGGRHGYDHKKLAITARGGWESVKRHFAERGHDTQSEPFTVVGIGDMAGDVFGNGMLLSRQIRLVAAFNHMHIFIDPDPDPESSYRERQRLFKKKGSAWTDYDRSLLSSGGAIHERSAKRIELSQAAATALGTTTAPCTPDQLIQAILTAPVDLLWNGGIGTYIKASGQSHAEVGDRANNAVRVNADNLRCTVIGEGGNLGMSQRGRIEYARQGGRVNTDFVDNAGGVGSSDREVNIKIPLNGLLANGELASAERDKLLTRMTRDLVASVLQDNRDQTLLLSLMTRYSAVRVGEQAQLVRYLEHHSNLDRRLESLPDEEELNERRSRGEGMVRPELAVLMAYSKMKLSHELHHAELVTDPFFESLLFDYFPKAVCSEHPEAISQHSLRADIIVTRLTNDFVNHVGFAFPHRPVMDRGQTYAHVAKAYVISSQLLNIPDWKQKISKVDDLPLDLMYELHARLGGLLKRLIWWFLDHDLERLEGTDIEQTLTQYRDGVAALRRVIPGSLQGSYHQRWQQAHANLREQGVPDRLARDTASIPVFKRAFDIVTLTQQHGIQTKRVASLYFALGERLHIPWLLDAVHDLESPQRWQAMARSRLREDVTHLHAGLTGKLLRWTDGKSGNPQRLAEAWLEAGDERVAFALKRLEELHASKGVDFASLSVAVGELRAVL